MSRCPRPPSTGRLSDGLREIPIEQRAGSEVSHITGHAADAGEIETVRLVPAESPVANYAFDVTPARLVTGLITERGVAAASREGLPSMFPDKRVKALQLPLCHAARRGRRSGTAPSMSPKAVRLTISSRARRKRAGFA